MEDYCVKADQLVDLALASGETEEVTTAMTEEQKTFRTSVALKMTAATANLICKKPAPVAQPPVRVGGEGSHGAAQEVGRVAEGTSSITQKKQFIKYRPQEMPKFAGKAKDYALWKKLWQEGISPQFEEGSQMMKFAPACPRRCGRK